ncbi:MAG: excinuclease ABC subunit UvrC [Gammaproteobacteria bacterium]|nr:excinuclease ABC subunit UvrC [Gammaproteobacteria bacterium]
MLDASGVLLYVGKARNLRKRVSSYFRSADSLPVKTRAMMAQVASVEVTVTATEGEALLLESNLIKAHRPRYNVVLRDDKSYPYIHVSAGEPFPRLTLHRGARNGGGRYLGPYPSAGAVRETLGLLEKLFQLRQCEDTFFRNRSRPCLQHQIQRCSAPCVGRITQQAYAEDVRHALMFLEGQTGEVIGDLVRRMELASRALDFERAARYRDQIAQLRRVSEHQYVTVGAASVDVVAAACRHGVACVQVFVVRNGRHLGNRTFFPEHAEAADEPTVLRAFLVQHYLASDAGEALPAEVLLSQDVDDRGTLAQLLSERAGRTVKVRASVRAERARWVAMALENVRLALAQRLATQGDLQTRFETLAEALGLQEVPGRIECFDVSHSRGEATVASCVAFERDGPHPSDYRRFNIRGIAPGDDYGAMRQAVERRYARVCAEEGKLPDVLLIDGGRGQAAEAERALEELQVTGVTVVGVAKGTSRKPGMESLFLPGSEGALILPPDSPALHLVQQVRDEAHRFAITAHRQRRANRRNTSVLESIPGIGPVRRRLLLTEFGGLRGLERAGVQDLAHVPGISAQLARKIYDALHADR